MKWKPVHYDEYPPELEPPVVDVPVMTCSRCEGRGKEPGRMIAKCERCKGTGETWIP